MSNIPPNINPFDPLSGRQVRVSEVQGDKHSKEKALPHHPNAKSSAIIEFLCLQLMQKSMQDLRKKRGKSALLSADETVGSALEKLRGLFTTLSDRDCSEDALFVTDLSRQWHILLRHTPFLIDSQKRKGAEELMNKLNMYPKNAPKRLGFYLKNYAGEKWLPFPLIEILKALYEEAQLRKEKSTLASWIQHLRKVG